MTVAAIAVASAAAALPVSTATAASNSTRAAVPAGSNSQLFAVSVAPKSTDAWALANNFVPGSTKVGDVVLHHHKNKWSKSATTGFPAKTTYLNGIAAASLTQIWLVGDYLKTGGSIYYPVIAKSKGAGFKTIKLPGFASGRLQAVAASSPSNVWVLGETADYKKNVAFRYNGKSWKKIPIPSPTGAVADQATLATSGPNDVWVLGVGSTTTIQHWNGRAWSLKPLPSPTEVIQGIATSRGRAWAVGYAAVSTSTVPLVVRWNGTAWKVVKLANAGGGETLQAVSVAGSKAYAVGRLEASDDTGDATPIAVTLGGAKPTVVAAKAVGTFSTLHAIASSTKAVVAVGDDETQAYCTSPFHSLAETIEHSKWIQAKIPAALVPASATGFADCA